MKKILCVVFSAALLLSQTQLDYNPLPFGTRFNVFRPSAASTVTISSAADGTISVTGTPPDFIIGVNTAEVVDLDSQQTIPGLKLLTNANSNHGIFTTYTIGEASLTNAATTQDITLFTLPAKGKICGAYVKHSTAFTGGGITAMTVSLGYSGSTTFYTAAFDIFQAVADTTIQDTALQKSHTAASEAVLARFTSTSANVSAATAGSVDVSVCTLVIP